MLVSFLMLFAGSLAVPLIGLPSLPTRLIQAERVAYDAQGNLRTDGPRVRTTEAGSPFFLDSSFLPPPATITAALTSPLIPLSWPLEGTSASTAPVAPVLPNKLNLTQIASFSLCLTTLTQYTTPYNDTAYPSPDNVLLVSLPLLAILQIPAAARGLPPDADGVVNTDQQAGVPLQRAAASLFDQDGLNGTGWNWDGLQALAYDACVAAGHASHCDAALAHGDGGVTATAIWQVAALAEATVVVDGVVPTATQVCAGAVGTPLTDEPARLVAHLSDGQNASSAGWQPVVAEEDGPVVWAAPHLTSPASVLVRRPGGRSSDCFRLTVTTNGTDGDGRPVALDASFAADERVTGAREGDAVPLAIAVRRDVAGPTNVSVIVQGSALADLRLHHRDHRAGEPSLVSTAADALILHIATTPETCVFTRGPTPPPTLPSFSCDSCDPAGHEVCDQAERRCTCEEGWFRTAGDTCACDKSMFDHDCPDPREGDPVAEAAFAAACPACCTSDPDRCWRLPDNLLPTTCCDDAASCCLVTAYYWFDERVEDGQFACCPAGTECAVNATTDVGSCVPVKASSSTADSVSTAGSTAAAVIAVLLSVCILVAGVAYLLRRRAGGRMFAFRTMDEDTVEE